MDYNLKIECDNFITELNKFSDNMKTHNVGINDSFFDKIEFDLPIDYKYLMTIFNGFSLAGNEVLGVDLKSNNSLLQIKHREQNDTEFKMPLHIIPFSADGRGNHYCFDMSKLDYKSKTCPIVFWQYGYSDETLDEVEVVNGNFVDWCKEVIIEWTLEEFDYKGNEVE